MRKVPNGVVDGVEIGVVDADREGRGIKTTRYSGPVPDRTRSVAATKHVFCYSVDNADDDHAAY